LKFIVREITKMHLKSILIIGLIALSPATQAEEVVLGWMNLDQCRTVEWRNDGFLGTPSPTYHESEQRAYVKLKYENFTGDQLVNEIKYCGEQGLGAATIAAIIANINAAAPTFYAVFQQCMGNLYSRVSNLQLSWESECL
jgi:hypothetical protein